MIVENGTIRVLTTSGGGMKHGIPVKVEEKLGESIPCNYRANHSDKKGIVVDNAFTRFSYTILIAKGKFDDAQRLKLFRMDGTLIGEFKIQDIQPLDFVDALQISV